MNDYIQLLLKLLEWAQDLGWFGIKVVVGIVVVSSLTFSIPITYICYLCRKPLSKYCWSKFCPQDMERLSVSKGHAEHSLIALIDFIHALEVLHGKKKALEQERYPNMSSLGEDLFNAQKALEYLRAQLELLPHNQEIRDKLLILNRLHQRLYDARKLPLHDIAQLNDLFDNIDQNWRGKKPEEFEQLKELKRILSKIANQETP